MATPEAVQDADQTVRRPRGLRALVTATYVSSLGDGALAAAAPLAAAAITRDPAAVALVSAAEYLPWLVVTPFAGALVDRWRLRTVLVVADVLRAGGLALLAILIIAGAASIPVLAATACAIVVGQIFGDTAAQTIVVDLAGRDSGALNKANGHISSATTAGKSLVGPPIGSGLYAAVPWLPFVLDAVSFAVSAGLVASLPKRRGPTSRAGRPRLLASIGEGARFLVQHAQLRVLCLLVASANLASFMAMSTFVLFATERLGVTTAGYGVLLAASAVGGVAGGFASGRIAQWLGARPTIIAGLALQVVVWPAIGWTSSPYIAGALLAVVGLCAAVTTVVCVTARQQLTPAAMLGRVISAFRTVSAGTAPLGALLGGGLAAVVDLRAPFYVAGVVLMAAVLVSLPSLRSVQADPISTEGVGQ
ncbi:MFS transporter [Actinopolymorpha pittospori]|uniref:MFS transporter n=1 Tax=Actinopolymorpha pittospori TaxID=648752 RepID=UPI0030807D2D